MATSTKRKPVFTPDQVSDRRKELLKAKHGISPVEVNEEGYWYDGVDVAKAMQKKAKEVKVESKNK